MPKILLGFLKSQVNAEEETLTPIGMAEMIMVTPISGAIFKN